MDKEVIKKVLDGLATEQEATDVARWFATSEGGLYLDGLMDSEFAQLRPGIEELLVDHRIPTDALYTIIEQRIRYRRRRAIWFRVAAIVLPLLCVSILFFQLNSRVSLFNPTYSEVYVPKGERIQLLFQDGTQVYLNSDSHLRYRKTFALNKRMVELDGEAYFIVAKNKKRPFFVHLRDMNVRVLGTQFNVQAYTDSRVVRVQLDEGSVQAEFPTQNYSLKKGEELLFDRESGTVLVNRPTRPEVRTAWTRDQLAFQDAPLSEVLRVLNRWYNVHFIVQDPRAYHIAYTFQSENTMLDKVLMDLERIAPVRFVQTNDSTVVLNMEYSK